MNWIAGAPRPPSLLPVLRIGVGMPVRIGRHHQCGGGRRTGSSCSRRARLFEGMDASGVVRGKDEFARSLLTRCRAAGGPP